MRHNAQARRMRGGRNNNHSGHSQGNNGQRRGFQNKNKVFDSNGPDVRIRGTAFQIVEKYATLAKDAHATGDWVLAESYLQHAEHYQRMISEWGAEEAQDQNNFADNDDAAAFDRFAISPGNSVAGTGPQPAIQTGGAPSTQEDLGLPSSLIGARKTSELAEA